LDTALIALLEALSRTVVVSTDGARVDSAGVCVYVATGETATEKERLVIPDSFE
jgi:hypothetical protein